MPSKAEFIDQYCISSGIDRAVFSRTFVVKACDCGEMECCGWAVMPRGCKAVLQYLNSAVRADGRPRSDDRMLASVTDFADAVDTTS